MSIEELSRLTSRLNHNWPTTPDMDELVDVVKDLIYLVKEQQEEIDQLKTNRYENPHQYH